MAAKEALDVGVEVSGAAADKLGEAVEEGPAGQHTKVLEDALEATNQ